MRQIKIERAVLIGGEHTEADTVLVVGTDIAADIAGRLVREGCATDASGVEVADTDDGEGGEGAGGEMALAEKPAKPDKAKA